MRYMYGMGLVSKNYHPDEIQHAPFYPKVVMGTSCHSDVGVHSDCVHSSVSTVAALLVVCYQVKSKSVWNTTLTSRLLVV